MKAINLKDYIKSKNITQSEFAKKNNKSPATITNMIRRGYMVVIDPSGKHPDTVVSPRWAIFLETRYS